MPDTILIYIYIKRQIDRHIFTSSPFTANTLFITSCKLGTHPCFTEKETETLNNIANIAQGGNGKIEI